MQYEWVFRYKNGKVPIPRNCEEVLSIIMRNRGFESESTLEPSLRKLEKYLCIRNIEDGARLVANHISHNHKIALVGDYDCDGITSLVQWTFFFEDIGYENFSVTIPERSEGYGFPERALAENPDARLFIVVDCGTYDRIPVEAARRNRADVVVIDHHKIEDISRLAPCTVLINPKHPQCGSWFKDFCSSGLTLMFLTKLRQFIPPYLARPKLDGRYQSLAALGTIADVMPLVEANRIIAKSGIKRINEDLFEPIKILKGLAGLEGKRISAGHLGFYIAPRVNAPGRIANPMVAYNFLTAMDRVALLKLGHELNRLNMQRQAEESKVFRKVFLHLKEEASSAKRKRSVVMAEEGWHSGVVGIVASKIIQECHYGPVIIGSIDEQGLIKASARSIPGVDICAALSKCEEYLIKWGGHEAAAGLALERKYFDAFKKRFEEVIQTWPKEHFRRKIYIDCELTKKLISKELVDILEMIEPYGQGNPAPTFLSTNMRITDIKVFGQNNRHLRLILEGKIPAIFWRGGSLVSHIKPGFHCNIVYQLEWNDQRHQCAMTVKDIECYKG